MEEIAKMLVATSPIAAVLLMLGTQALSIWRNDLQQANVKRDNILKRIVRIEAALGIAPDEDDLRAQNWS